MKLRSNFRYIGFTTILAIVVLVTTCKKDEPSPIFNDQGNIGSDGGIVKTSDGASVEIPPDALSTSQTISITNITEGGTDSDIGSQIYELKPDGLTFKDSVIITLPFDDEFIDLNSPEENYGINVAVVQDLGLLNLKAEIDLINNAAIVKTKHFSDYIISFRSQWAEYYENNKDGASKIISVPYYEQEGNWCFYYSLSMIAKYAGYSYKAPFYAYLFGETYPETTGFIGFLGLDEADLLLLKGLGISFNYKILWTNVDNLYGYILYNLNKNVPVEVLSIKQGHAIVVAGHDQTGFFVNDPNTPPLLTHYSYENFEEFWIGTKNSDFCNTLIITSIGNESRLGYTVNFYENDFLIKENQNSVDNIGFLDINGVYATYGYSLVDISTSKTGNFDGSNYIHIKPHLSNSESSAKTCKLHVKIDNNDIVGSPQTVTLTENLANYYKHNPMVSRLTNLPKGKHKISVELRSTDSYTLYDYWNFEINIANEYIDYGHPPVSPSSPNPSNGATGVSTSLTLTWSCTDPDAGDQLTYDIYFGTSENTLVQIVSNLTTSSISRSSLSQGVTYFWRVVAKDNHGNSTTGPIWSFTIGTPPDVDFTYSPGTVYAGQTIQFTDQSSNNTTGWAWDFGDGGTSSLQNPTHKFNNVGTYEVNLTASNIFGWSVASSSITVNPVVNPPLADFTASSTTITAGGSVTFTDKSTNSPTSWSWNFGDGGTSTSQSPSHTYSAAGTYTVTLTATNSAGSDGETKNGYITVNSVVIAPVAAFSASSTTITAGGTVNFTDQSTNSPTSWNWNFGDGGTSTSQNPSYTYSTAGTYTITLTATNSAGSDGEIKTGYITVNSVVVAPVADFIASQTTITAGGTVDFSDQSTNSPTSWSWNFGDGGTSTSQNPSHTYSTAGTYTVTLTATNSAGSDGETKSGYITVNIPLTTVSDIDGNTYNIVTIGTQVWMRENLKTTKYNDGTNIPLVTDNTEWTNLTTLGYCW
jgi:PKD repeat protein